MTVMVLAPSDNEATPARAFLVTARTAVEAGRTGEAEEALERAETRLLGYPAPPSGPPVAADDRAVRDIGEARHHLASRDRPAALLAIDDALAATDIDALPPPAPPDLAAAPAHPPAPMVVPAVAAVPTTTKALLPGHWQLDGAQWVWVPPETVLRPVQSGARVPGRYVWIDGAYTWVAAHYAAP